MWCIIRFTVWTTFERIYNRVYDTIDNSLPLFRGEALASVVFFEICAYIIVGVLVQMIYIITTGDKQSLYYNYDTLDIINNFNNIININNEKISLLGGNSTNSIFNNYKNIAIIILLCSAIFILNKIKKSKEYYE